MKPSSEEKDVTEYLDWIRQRLHREYRLWALEHLERELPRGLGEHAGTLGRLWREEDHVDWHEAFRHLGLLLERTIELTWAVAAALVRHARLKSEPMPNLTVASKEIAIASHWKALDADKLLFPWTKFIGGLVRPDAKSPGTAFLDAVRALRVIRNANTHGSLPNPSREDLEAQKDDILRLIDGLALWAERPLLTSPRYHPGQRGVIQYNRLSGPTPGPIARVPDRLSDPLNAKPGRTYMFWEKDDEHFLLDLYPFVIMGRNSAGRTEPQMLQFFKHGEVTYMSLNDGQITKYKRNGPGPEGLLQTVADALSGM